MLETFGYVEELHQAILAARDVDPKIPLVAHVTIDEDGNCLDGSTPESFTPRIESWGADVIGCNCSVGPVAMLDVIERVRALTSLPLAAQPNAGMPRSVEGRNIYLCSPEYMASYARKFVAAGVRLVGGCCGTTPEHIRVMKSALRVGEARAKAGPSQERAKPRQRLPAVPLAKRSRLGAKIAAGEFVTMVEIVPPKGTDVRKEIEGARFLKSVGVDAINIPDSPRASARMSNQALSLLVQQEVGIEAILHYTCRDRNVLSMQSDLLGASALGIHNLICITGDPPKMGNYPDATAVFDVDAIGLVNIVHNLNRGLDIGGNPLGAGTSFVIGVGANPGRPQYRRGNQALRVQGRGRRRMRGYSAGVRSQAAGNIPAPDRTLQDSGHRRNLAAGQRSQCRVHEERTASLGAGLHSGAHGQGQDAGGGSRRRRRHRPRNADRGAWHGAGSADQRALRTIYFGGGCAGSVGNLSADHGLRLDIFAGVIPLAKFEECLQRLEKIVQELEKGEVPLEKSLTLFEEGMQLSAACRKELEEAEGKVEILLKQNGKLQAEAFEPDRK